MKRLFLILLFTLLPLQTGWAAGWCVISDEASVTAAASDMTDAEDSKKTLLESGCSVICVSACDLQPLGSGLPVLDCSERSPSAPPRFNPLSYQSPIFDGLIRPK